jgi:thiol:disulfide interchange protein DsbD
MVKTNWRISVMLCAALLTGPVFAGIFEQLDRLGSGGQREFLPPDRAFELSHEDFANDQLPLTWAVAEGYYLYRDKIKVVSPDGSAIIAPLNLPPGEDKDDEEFGRVKIYRENVRAMVGIQPAPARTQVTLQVTYQGCAEDGICYPPINKTLLLAVGAPAGPAGVATAAPSTVRPVVPSLSAVSQADRLGAVLADRGVFAVALTFLGFGLLLSLTPCVFPMIPILSGILVGERSRSGSHHGLLLSAVYVLAMAATYAVVGLAAGVFGSNLQATFQHPAAVIGFSAVFVVLALSMFGLFSLQLPAALRVRLASTSRGARGGSLVGVAIMGSLSAIMVGPCVAPPLAGALLYLGHQGSPLVGGLALFAMGLGMGLPLLLVGASAGHWLPRAGVWLERVQQVFGVVSLAVAVWFLERIVPPALALALWALLLIGAGIFLGALEPLRELASGWARLWKTLGVALLGYGGVLMVGAGAGAGAEDVFHPLAPFVARSSASPAAVKPVFGAIKSTADLAAALASAAVAGRPVMLDVYADWCVECKRLERDTFGDPVIAAQMTAFTLLRVDVTANDDADRALLASLELFGPPAVLLYDARSQERRDLRLIGYTNAADFAQRLRGLVTP